MLILIVSWVLQAPTRPNAVVLPGLGLKLNAGWTLIIEHRCRYSVPREWTVSGDARIATAPDGSALTVWAIDSQSWPVYEALMRRTFTHVTAVHEDSDRRWWVEIDDNAVLEHRIAAGDARVTCAAVLDIRSGGAAAEVARTIAASVGPAPDKWSPQSR